MLNLPLAMMGMPMGMEWLIIGGVVVLLFGAKKVPELMRGVGQGVGELKKGLDEGKKAFEDHSKDEPKPEETAKVQETPKLEEKVGEK